MPQPNPAGSHPTIQIRALGGPALGQIHLVGPAEIVLTPNILASFVSGILHVRAVDGTPIAALKPGQQFQADGSLWQAGNSTSFSHLMDDVGARLNRIAGTEPLEGFSLKEMFSEVFRHRTTEEIDDYFIAGTSRTTPDILDVPTGWPKPWFFFRVLAFVGLVYVIFAFAMDRFLNNNLIPGMIMMGSFAVPLSVVVLFFELNTPRNVALHRVLMLVCMGGVLSLTVSLTGFRTLQLGWMGDMSAGIIEEVGKLIGVVLIARATNYRYILNGMLCGAAVGAGFAAFESAGYAFNFLLKSRSLDVMTNVIYVRALLTPFGHVAWTAIAAGALWRSKGLGRLSFRVLADSKFWGAFAVPVVLHMLWDSPLPSPMFLLQWILGAVAWFVAFGLIQQGLRQVRDVQRAIREESVVS